MSLRKFSWRSMKGRPGRTVLTLLSIVIGVAATVSFSIVTQTTRDAYQQMFALVTGRAALEVTAAGETRFEQEVVDKVSAVPHVKAAVPAVRRVSTLFAHGQRANLQALGIDVERDRLVRDYEFAAGKMLAADDELLLDAALARRLGVSVGEPVKLLSDRGLRTFTLAGLIEPKGGAALRQAGMALITLKKAQSIFRAPGKIDVIQIVLEPDCDQAQVQAAIQAAVPEGLEVRPPSTTSELMKETLLGSEQALRLASLFSLLLASFIILNTFLMNVGERRRQLAILRAVGATSGQIRRSLIGESVVLGAVGSVLGLGLGIAVAVLINRSLAHALNVAMPSAEWSAEPLVLATLFGMGMSVAGAFVPAVRAGRVSPLEGLNRVTRADIEGVSWRYLVAGGLLTVVSAVFVIIPLFGWLPIIVPTYASVFLLLGIVLLSPIVLAPLVHACAWMLRPVLNLEGRLAVKQLLRHRTRTTLTAGVLFVAASTGVGIAYAILDNIHDVRDWYRQTFAGDFFIRAMLPDMATGLAADLPEELEAELRRIPHIASIESAAMVDGRIGETKVIVIARDFVDEGALAFDLVAGDRSRVIEQIKAGQVVIGSVLALRLNVHLHDQIELDTSSGPQRVTVCGIANEYLVGGYSVYLHRRLAEQWLGVTGADGFGIRTEPEHRDEVQAALQALCDKHGVLLHSFAEIVQQIEFMIQGIVGCLWGILILGFVVGAFGVVNTLTMNVLEQTRELGLLRIVAMTRRQVRRTILTQALIMGVVGILPGVVGGLITAYVMNVATMPSIGHPVEFGFRPFLLAGALFGALAITLAAAWIPAQRAARIDVVKALHYE